MLITLALIALAACSPAEDEVGAVDLDSLTETGGCADVTMYAANPEGSAILWVQLSGSVLEDAYAEGVDSVVRSFVLGEDPDIEVSIDVGSNVAERACNDVMTEYVIDERWVAIEGTVAFEATLTAEEAEPWNMPADATVTLTEVLLEEQDTGAQMLIGSLTIEAGVGWLPG